MATLCRRLKLPKQQGERPHGPESDPHDTLGGSPGRSRPIDVYALETRRESGFYHRRPAA